MEREFPFSVTAAFRLYPILGVCSPWANQFLWDPSTPSVLAHGTNSGPGTQTALPRLIDGSEEDQRPSPPVFQIQYRSEVERGCLACRLVEGHEPSHGYPADRFLRIGSPQEIQMMRSYRISHFVRRFCSISLDEIAENTP